MDGVKKPSMDTPNEDYTRLKQNPNKTEVNTCDEPPPLQRHISYSEDSEVLNAEKFVQNFDDINLDAVDERILDVFTEGTNILGMSRYSEYLTEDIVKEMIAEDPKWVRLSQEAKKTY